MVILITGASHTGKTALAQRLLEKHGFPCVSMDHIKMGLIRSGYTSLSPADDEAMTVYLWPVIREMIKTAVENRQNLIVEGCYVPFGWRQEFGPAYLKEIRFLCLAFTERYIERHFGDIQAHASDIERRLYDGWLTPAKLKEVNAKMIAGFRAAGETVTVIDDDYAQKIDALVTSF